MAFATENSFHVQTCLSTNIAKILKICYMQTVKVGTVLESPDYDSAGQPHLQSFIHRALSAARRRSGLVTGTDAQRRADGPYVADRSVHI